MNQDEVRDYIQDGAEVRRSIDFKLVYETGMQIAKKIKNGGKLVLFGNGGSAADSQHIAAELVGHFEMERKPLPAMALTVNTSSLTAIANDYDYNEIFSRQVRAFCDPKDCVIGISTSGHSKNVVMGLRAAKQIGCLTISFTGKNGNEVSGESDICIRINSTRTSIIQESHIAVGHIFSKIIEDYIFH